ncbi:metallophosphoesterase family protein [Polaribacter glomeratus]|uniref:Uncharacterized protein n=1 Tax=Polaribacter glomeratus TaxID=102 RepID=A0A2S7WZ50_9FLAO|nr:hypothetical protein [Polaribacter glomeratus]PQJ82612.1 hypothetical protein BTO16_08500 [Polaribacter glomeratus]TXD64932.1 hypothetical protein ESX12_12365 [Polaribacter glomeratus]
MKHFKKFKKAFGLNEIRLIDFPKKQSNVKISRICNSDKRGGCSWCFSHGIDTNNSKSSKYWNNRSWKSYRNNQFKKNIKLFLFLRLLKKTVIKIYNITHNNEIKIFIAGNYDFFFERAHRDIIKNKIPKNVIYLNDSGCEIADLKIWGSPVQPEFYNWAFNIECGKEIKQHWDLIPKNIDILITHGPPYGILDKTTRNDLVGCE